MAAECDNHSATKAGNLADCFLNKFFIKQCKQMSPEPSTSFVLSAETWKSLIQLTSYGETHFGVFSMPHSVVIYTAMLWNSGTLPWRCRWACPWVSVALIYCWQGTETEPRCEWLREVQTAHELAQRHLVTAGNNNNDDNNTCSAVLFYWYGMVL